MRLIDVDNFEEKNAKMWDLCGKEDCYYSVGYILSQASIDAVPIEWIKEWLKKQEVYIRNQKVYLNTNVLDLLKDWRREEKKDER